MSTTTVTFGHGSATPAATKPSPRRSFFQRLIDARTLQAQARIRSVFGRMSDAQLTDIGFTADQIRDVRSKGSIPASYWS